MSGSDDVTKALEEAIKKKLTVVVSFSEKPTGLYQPILGIVFRGRMLIWSRRLKK